MSVKLSRGLPGVGIFTVEVGIGRLFGGPMSLVSAMVDTGTFNSMMPVSLLTQLGVTPNDRRKYALADNSEVEYDIGIAYRD